MEVWNAIRNSLPALQKVVAMGATGAGVHKTEESLRQAIANFITRKDLRFHLYMKETGEFIGSSGLHRIDWSIPKFEIGYWLAYGI